MHSKALAVPPPCEGDMAYVEHMGRCPSVPRSDALHARIIFGTLWWSHRLGGWSHCQGMTQQPKLLALFSFLVAYSPMHPIRLVRWCTKYATKLLHEHRFKPFYKCAYFPSVTTTCARELAFHKHFFKGFFTLLNCHLILATHKKLDRSSDNWWPISKQVCPS
jgi:hypothetical protein